MRSSVGPGIVIFAFAVSGTAHLLRPQLFEPIVPRILPWRPGLVYTSGVAELSCAAGMLVPQTRGYAAWASAAVLVAVFPANVQMAIDAHRAIGRAGSTPARQAARGGDHPRAITGATDLVGAAQQTPVGSATRPAQVSDAPVYRAG